MTVLALSLFVLSLALTWYALWGRAWLKTKSWAKPFFDLIEPLELVLFKKSETILFARMKMVTGLLLAFLTQIGTIDLTPIMPFVPEKYQSWVHAAFNLAPLMLSIVGWMDEKLRNRTTLPIEVVSVPDKVMAENPKVAEAVSVAAIAKQESITAINEEKAA